MLYPPAKDTLEFLAAWAGVGGGAGFGRLPEMGKATVATASQTVLWGPNSTHAPGRSHLGHLPSRAMQRRKEYSREANGGGTYSNQGSTLGTVRAAQRRGVRGVLSLV